MIYTINYIPYILYICVYICTCTHTHSTSLLIYTQNTHIQKSVLFLIQNQRIILVGKDLSDHQVPLPAYPDIPTNHVPQCHIDPFLDHLQGCWPHNLPGQLMSVQHHSFWEEIKLKENPSLLLTVSEDHLTSAPVKEFPIYFSHTWVGRRSLSLSLPRCYSHLFPEYA